MKIIVLVKQVPDTTEMKVDKETGVLIRTGVPTIINPDDLAAVEAALRIPNAHVHCLSMGPIQAKSMMRELLGMGVDQVTLITDRQFAGSDTWATSNTLAEAIKIYEYDLIFAGRQAIDGDTAQVGPQVAEKLCIPQITYVSKINQIDDHKIRVTRDYEDYAEVLEAKFPVLITTLSEINSPRYPRVDYLWDSFDKEINIITNMDLRLDEDHTGLSGSPTQVKRTFPRQIEKLNEIHQLSPNEAAQGIARLLKPYLGETHETI